MPLVTTTLQRGSDAATRGRMLDAVHGALAARIAEDVAHAAGLVPDQVMIAFVETAWRTGRSAAGGCCTRKQARQRAGNGGLRYLSLPADSKDAPGRSTGATL